MSGIQIPGGDNAISNAIIVSVTPSRYASHLESFLVLHHFRSTSPVTCACAVPVARSSTAIPDRSSFFIAISYHFRSSVSRFPHYDLRYIDEMRRIALAPEAHATPRVFRPTL